MRILENLIFLNLCFFACAEIVIKKLNIPDGIEQNKTDEVILDCDFTFDETDEEGLEVKWFFPHDKKVIYQWIPDKDGTRKPTVRQSFKSVIDVDYKASDNPLMMHRALKITKISTELTGNYTCAVSSFRSEDRKGKRLVIYRKADKVEFIHLEDSNRYICAAYGVYPKPIMNIFVQGSNLTKVEDGDDNEYNNPESNEEDDDTVDELNGIYNVTSSYKYLKSEIKDQTQFICELRIPDTDYHERFYSNLFPENSGSIHRLSWLILTGLIFVIINYC